MNLKKVFTIVLISCTVGCGKEVLYENCTVSDLVADEAHPTGGIEVTCGPKKIVIYGPKVVENEPNVEPSPVEEPKVIPNCCKSRKNKPKERDCK